MSYLPPHKKKNSRFDSLKNENKSFFSEIKNDNHNDVTNNRFQNNPKDAKNNINTEKINENNQQINEKDKKELLDFLMD